MLLFYYLAITLLMLSPCLMYMHQAWIRYFAHLTMGMWSFVTMFAFVAVPWKGLNPKPYTDIWSLGTILFCMMLVLALSTASIRKKPWQHWLLFVLSLIASCGCSKVLISTL